MKKTRLSKSLSFILCIVLIAAIALTAFGCSDNTNDSSSGATTSPVTSVSPEATDDSSDSINVLGEGSTVFTFTVTDTGGKETSFEIHTDKAIVGDALTELGLISGEEGAYGLYVKTVSGITLDYDKDGKYWAFYVNDEYASTGVDMTSITAGATYSFKAE